MKDLVLACSLQRAYFHETGTLYFGEKAEIYKQRLVEYFKELNPNDYQIIFLREIHQPDDKFYMDRKSGSIVGSNDVEILEIFKPYAKLIVNTNRYSGFYKTPLDSELNKIKPNKIHIVGVETHTNVLFTAEELRNRNYAVVVHEPLVTSAEDFMHNTGINVLSNVLSVEVD